MLTVCGQAFKVGKAVSLTVVLVALLAAPAVAASPAPATASCSARILADWRDGRIDRTYPPYCYRQALEQLPEDVRVYSSAEDDITRALQHQLSERRPAAAAQDGNGGESVPLLVVALISGLLLAAASLAVVVR